MSSRAARSGRATSSPALGTGTGGTGTYTVTTSQTISSESLTAGTTGGNTITATGASASETLTYTAGASTDSFSGGAEKDVVYVTAAAVGSDTLTGGSNSGNTLILTTAGTAGLTHVSKFGTINLAAGANAVTLAAGTLNGSVTINDGTSGNNTVTASSNTTATTTTLTYVTGTGTDTFHGGAEIDVVKVAATHLSAGGGDTLTGGSNAANDLIVTTAGAVDLTHVSGFGTINLAGGGNQVTVVAGTLAGSVTIVDGGSNNSVNASGNTTVTGTTLTYVAANGTDTFTGGAETDVVKVAATRLVATTGGDTLTGGGSGANTLVLTGGGTANLANVSNFNTIDLNASGNTVILPTTAFTGATLTINDGTSGNNVINASAVGSTSTVLDYIVGSGSDTFTGGAENDVINASANTSTSKGKVLTVTLGTGTDTLTGGFENDVVKGTATQISGDTLTGGSGNNTLTVTNAGTTSLSGVSKFGTINLTAGINTVTVANGTLSGGAVTIKDAASSTNTIDASGVSSLGKTLTYIVGAGSTDIFSGGAENDVINASADTTASSTKSLTFTAGTGTDTLTGGFEQDLVNIAAANVAGDSLTGGSNAGNTLTLTTSGVARLSGVTKFGTIDLHGTTGNTVTVFDTTLAGGAVTISDGTGGSNNSVIALNDTGSSSGKTLTYNAGTGVDSFSGGFEKDVVNVAAANLKVSGGDTLTGSTNTANILNLTGTGAANLSAVRNFATINLNVGGNAVTVVDATLSGGAVTIKDTGGRQHRQCLGHHGRQRGTDADLCGRHRDGRLHRRGGERRGLRRDRHDDNRRKRHQPIHLCRYRDHRRGHRFWDERQQQAHVQQ